ncbi:MAG: elongation factor [Bacteroidetes bacterium]|nr:elongation factor [Bacteroidota bacterium]
MKVYQTNEIKNISLLGSSGAGKTTLMEAMLYESGVIKRRGSINNQNTVSDYFPVEKEYGYSVFSSVLSYEWKNKMMNFIDCPGSDDFVGAVFSSLNMTDMAVMLIDAVNGVEVGTMNQFRYTEELHKPVVFLINQFDHEKADYENTLTNLKEVYGSKVVPIQYTIGSGQTFEAIVDVLKQKMYKWKPGATAPEVLDIPESEKDKAEEFYKVLLEAAAENDENLMEKYFEQGSLTEEEMREGIMKGMIDRSLFPVFCASAEKNMAVHRIMNFLSMVAPSPDQMPAPINTDGKEVKPNSSGPTSLFFFKTTVEPHIGEVSYFKVMSGKVKPGDDLMNVNRSSKERITQIFSVSGQIRTAVDEMVAGNIGATVKLKDTRTGIQRNKISRTKVSPCDKSGIRIG